jgi:hypothetical protein
MPLREWWLSTKPGKTQKYSLSEWSTASDISTASDLTYELFTRRIRWHVHVCHPLTYNQGPVSRLFLSLSSHDKAVPWSITQPLRHTDETFLGRPFNLFASCVEIEWRLRRRMAFELCLHRGLLQDWYWTFIVHAPTLHESSTGVWLLAYQHLIILHLWLALLNSHGRTLYQS